MEELLSDLRACIEADDCRRAADKLNDIIDRSGELRVSGSEPFEALLGHRSNDILKLSAQAVAELAKVEENRACFTKPTVIKPLIPLLQSSDPAVVLQTCRALGNICFENAEVRKIIGKPGLTALVELIRTTAASEPFDAKLISICCGCLMNMIMCDDDLQKACLDCKVLDVFEAILKHNLADFEALEDCTTHSLLILNMVAEHMIDEWLSLGLCCIIVDILKVSMNPEISTMCLELLRMQSENDEIKFCLAKKGTCELVYDLVERHGNHVDDEDSRSVLKMACDLIVVILTGDESMELLYDNGNGKVYEQMVFWLNSEDVDLLSTGVLAIGNFARNDAHCIQMVENGLAKKLLGILKYYSTDGDTKVQHALLSTLRNLSIPAANKSKLLDENLVDTLLSMLNINQSPVEFKLLGTLRMVVDGQEQTALELIERKEFVEKLVHWCYNSDHLGVRGEAPRLLAWLIKNCHSPTSYPVVLSIPNSVKCLVEMMSSMHAVMQNEALLALNLLCASCLNNETNLAALLLEADISKSVNFVIEKYGEKLEKETISNVLALLEQLVRVGSLSDDLARSGLWDSFRKLLVSNGNAAPLADRINQLTAS